MASMTRLIVWMAISWRGFHLQVVQVVAGSLAGR